MATSPTREIAATQAPGPIAAEPLTAEAFYAYGEIVENRTGMRRRDLSVPFRPADVPVSPALWVNRLEQHRSMAIHVDSMECHPHSAQTFIPMSPSRCLAVVALPGSDGKPDLNSVRAFVTRPGQARDMALCVHFVGRAQRSGGDHGQHGRRRRHHRRAPVSRH